MSRLASEHEAAESVGIDVATFRAWVDCGRLPKPIADCNKFDLKAIDVALDRISGLNTPRTPTYSLDAWEEKKRAG